MRLPSGLMHLAFVAGVLLLGAGPAAAERLVVTPDRLHPTQMEIGRDEAAHELASWRHKADKKGYSLAKYARKVLIPKFERKGLPAVIDPAGRVRNTDGHHRVTALLQVARETGVEVPVGVEIIADYRGWSERRYAEDFVLRLHKGQFTPRVAKLSPLERVRRLPRTYGQLRDNPMRSAVAEGFRRAGIDDLHFVDYVEFKVGERLIADGLLAELRGRGVLAPRARSLAPGLALDERVQALIADRLARPDMRAWLRGLAAGKKDRRGLDKAWAKTDRAPRDDD